MYVKRFRDILLIRALYKFQYYYYFDHRQQPDGHATADVTAPTTVTTADTAAARHAVFDAPL